MGAHYIEGIRNGFDAGIKEQFSYTVIHPNHASSTVYPNFISLCIGSEIAAGRYSRGYTKTEDEQTMYF